MAYTFRQSLSEISDFLSRESEFEGYDFNISKRTFQRDIKEFALSMPPLEEQREVVRLIESYLDFAVQIEKLVKEAKIRADKIDQSILAKAFSGELVPQDPNDEPASVLLEKIKNEKELEINSIKRTGKKIRRSVIRSR